MKIGRLKGELTVVLAVALLPSGIAQALPTGEQVGNAVIGGALGGLLGNQVGNGRGKTAATAVGAATGVVIASGCTAGAGTAVGGLLGGLLGSQLGGGNAKNVMAGVGASLGALLGSDCQPGLHPAAAAPLAKIPPFKFNDTVFTPMNGFPPAAFQGIPPIVTLADVSAAAKLVRLLSDRSAAALREGNVELAALTMYWAKRYSAVAISVMGASLQTIQNAQTASISIPAKAVVILPAFNEYKPADSPKTAELLGVVNELMAASDYANSHGIWVADNSALGGFGELLNALGGGQAAPPQAAAPAPQAPQAPLAAAANSLVGLPLDVVLKMPDGQSILRTADALSIYNPNGVPAKLDLSALDFMPRTLPPSLLRQKAAPYIFAANEANVNWSFEVYAKTRGFKTFMTAVKAPNQVVDMYDGNRVVAYFDENARLSNPNDPKPGIRAYKSNVAYRKAIDIVAAANHSTQALHDFGACRTNGLGGYDVLDGLYATQLQTVCFTGNVQNRIPVFARSYHLGEDGDLLQTVDSMMREQKNREAMTKALANGAAVTDLVSVVPVVGNVESGLQCFGQQTMAQMGFVAAATMDAGLQGTYLGSVYNSKDVSINKNVIAKLSGWEAPPSEWSSERVMNCVGMVPVGGAAAQKAGKVVQAAVKSSVQVTDAQLVAIGKMVDIFSSPSASLSFAKDLKNGRNKAEELFPNNPELAKFVKTTYDTYATGLRMEHVYQDMSTLLTSSDSQSQSVMQ